MELYKIKRLFANILFPPKCISCGELLDIDGALNRLGAWVEKKLSPKAGEGDRPSLATGFVNCTILFCVGSMAILGAIEDIGTGTPDILFSKAVLEDTEPSVNGRNTILVQKIIEAIYQTNGGKL